MCWVAAEYAATISACGGVVLAVASPDLPVDVGSRDVSDRARVCRAEYTATSRPRCYSGLSKHISKPSTIQIKEFRAQRFMQNRVILNPKP